MKKAGLEITEPGEFQEAGGLPKTRGNVRRHAKIAEDRQEAGASQSFSRVPARSWKTAEAAQACLKQSETPEDCRCTLEGWHGST